MEDLVTFFGGGLKILEQLLNSPFFTVIKFFLAIYLTVLIVDIILLFVMRGVTADYQVAMKGMAIPSVSKGKMAKRWEKVLAKLEGENISQYKLAILEADQIVDKILSGVGYKGENMSERLSQISPEHLESLGALKKAHQVRNQIVFNESFKVDREIAKKTIKVYEDVLRALEFL